MSIFSTICQQLHMYTTASFLNFYFIISFFAGIPTKKAETCEWNGTPLHGRVQFVENNPDLRVKVVDAFPDLKVQVVEAFAETCGEWQIVTNFPDLKVQYVDSFADLKIQFVDAFPGLGK